MQAAWKVCEKVRGALATGRFFYNGGKHDVE